jgi:hypothetical protein
LIGRPEEADGHLYEGNCRGFGRGGGEVSAGLRIPHGARWAFRPSIGVPQRSMRLSLGA